MTADAGPSSGSAAVISRVLPMTLCVGRRPCPVIGIIRRNSLELRRLLVIANLGIERTREGGSRGTALDVGCQALIACDNVGMPQHSQHSRHHEIPGREAV